MRLYETGFLIAPTLSEEEAETLISQMADIIVQRNGRLVKQEKWGKRRLAYPIKKFNEANYVFFHYEGEADIPQELGRRFRHMDTILRHLTVKKEMGENIRNKKKAERISKRREEAAEEEVREERRVEEKATEESHE